jgi:aminopeptidase-like protein
MTATAPATGAELHGLAARLFPIARSLTGPGLRETLGILEEVAGSPMEVHRWATGEQVFDWTIPEEWAIRDAWIRRPDGEKVVDFADSNLHVLGYSEPVRKRLPLDELERHLHSLPELPHAIPYVTSYYARRWGFCLQHERRERLAPGEYEVCIDADLGPGHVEVGEIALPGETADEILFSTYVCHPSLANNELSGPVIAAHLARALRDRPRRFTYRIVFVPETIGSIAYLHRFGDRMLARLKAGYVITCAGDPGPFTYKRSRGGASLADRAAEHVLRESGAPHRVVDFFPSGSDERQYCSPGFNLPVGSLMRTMYGTYPEYHTSLDDLEFVTPDGLGGTLDMYLSIVDVLEGNETLETTVRHCEPQLGKRGLYPTLGGARDRQERVNDMMWLLNMCDGTRDLLAVAERAGRPVAALAPVAAELKAGGLLFARDVPPGQE